MSIIWKHSWPCSSYIIYVFLSLWVAIYHFFQVFKVHQKWYSNGLGYKNRYLERNHTVLASKYSTWAYRRHLYIESPTSSESALLCTSESLCLFFDFSFVFFFSVRLYITIRFCTFYSTVFQPYIQSGSEQL